MARKDSKVAIVFGCGLQAKLHIEIIVSEVESLKRIYVWNRTKENALSFIQQLSKKFSHLEFLFVEDVGEAVGESDLIVTCTNASEPLFEGRRVKRGAHVCCIGSFQPQNREVDTFLVKNSLCVVDSFEAEETSGEFCIPKEEGELEKEGNFSLGEIGELINKKEPIRKSGEEITLFKSVGNAVQDLFISTLVFQNAKKLGIGKTLTL